MVVMVMMVVLEILSSRYSASYTSSPCRDHRPMIIPGTLQREQFLLEPLTTKLCDLRVHDVCVLLDAASYSYCYYYYYNGPHRPPIALPQASRGVLELPLQRPSVEADAYLPSTAVAIRAR